MILPNHEGAEEGDAAEGLPNQVPVVIEGLVAAQRDQTLPLVYDEDIDGEPRHGDGEHETEQEEDAVAYAVREQL